MLKTGGELREEGIGIGAKIVNLSPTEPSSSSATDSTMTDCITNLSNFLNFHCGICHRCIQLLIDSDDASFAEELNNTHDSTPCTICLGLSSPSFQENTILPEIERSLLPYCSNNSGATHTSSQSRLTLINGKDGNYLSRESPTVQIPLLVQIRAHCAVAAAKSFLRSCNNATTSNDECNIRITIRSAEHVYLGVKEQVKSTLKELCQSLVSVEEKPSKRDSLSQQMHNEEAGYLSIHTIILPSISSPQTPAWMIPPTLTSYLIQHYQQIQSQQYKILHPRTRFRGNDPTLKQGGDARKNLELRLRREIMFRVSQDGGEGKRQRLNDGSIAKMDDCDLDAVILWIDKDTINHWCKEGECVESSEWLQKLHTTQTELSSHPVCSVHATTWRRPFCIHGYYTKTRRDVSQTPFYVSSSSLTEEANNSSTDANGTETTKTKPSMKRKGFSSVEEEICPHLSTGCGGISTRNNDPSSTVVYGMCKFHASGREDMDVRMLLPHPSVGSSDTITGRPFVCDIIDAHCIPTLGGLKHVEDAINGRNETNEDTKSDGEVEWDEKDWPHSLVNTNRSYGNNRNGVGVSSLEFVPSSAFSTLQSETENKVKHYGCICWSQQPIASDDFLCQKLRCSVWNEANIRSTTKYPMKIEQNTPLRVLHRRSSDIRTRYILSLSARRIGEHWFQLRMATSAGTYVKEFVHGDCGRTYPSVGSMLGSRVDITELDCEGIAVDG